MSGLRNLCRAYGAMTIQGVRWVWDYVAEEPVKESDMPVGSERWRASEAAKRNDAAAASEKEGARLLLPIGTTFVSRYSKYWGGEGRILSRDRWRWEVTVRGYNGVGGYWIDEAMKWDGSGQTHHVQARTLSREDSVALEEVYAKGPEAPTE